MRRLVLVSLLFGCASTAPRPPPAEPLWLVTAREYVGMMASCSPGNLGPCSDAAGVQQALAKSPRPSVNELRQHLAGQDRAAALVAAWVLRIGDEAFYLTILEQFAVDTNTATRRYSGHVLGTMGRQEVVALGRRLSRALAGERDPEVLTGALPALRLLDREFAIDLCGNLLQAEEPKIQALAYMLAAETGDVMCGLKKKLQERSAQGALDKLRHFEAGEYGEFHLQIPMQPTCRDP